MWDSDKLTNSKSYGTICKILQQARSTNFNHPPLAWTTEFRSEIPRLHPVSVVAKCNILLKKMNVQGEQHEVVLPTGLGNRCLLLWAQEGDLCRVCSFLLNSSHKAIFPLGIAACPDKDYQSFACTEHYTYLISVAVYIASFFFFLKKKKKSSSLQRQSTATFFIHLCMMHSLL